MKIVLDTNVWLDALVFTDAKVVQLTDALRQAQARIALNVQTANELVFVLQRFAANAGVNVARRDNALQAAQACKGLLGTNTQAISSYTAIDILRITEINIDIKNYSVDSIKLPRCKDISDQMFIELAASVGAQLLITQDRALLRCRRYPFIANSSARATHGLIRTPLQSLALLSDS